MKTDYDEPVIKGWQCPACEAIYEYSGPCLYHEEGVYLKPIVEDIPE